MTWRETVNATKAENPGIPFKEVLKKTSVVFRNPPAAPETEPPKKRYTKKQPPRDEAPAV